MLNHRAFIYTMLLILLLILSWVILERIQDYDMLKILSGSSLSIQNELRFVEEGSNSYPPSPAPAPLPIESTGNSAAPSNSSHELGDEFGENRNLCDIYSGRWVFDPGYPIYNSSACPLMEDGWRCQENGRPDTDYLKWRWQPSACDLPRFNASRMLQMLKNKRVVFSGDSLGRNQWQSFLCMLYQGLENKSRVFETRGQGINRISGVFKFQDYNLTVEYYVSHFLMLETRKPPNAPIEAKSALRLDLVTSSYKQWLGADILIFNTGHWWDHKDLRTGTTVFQVGNSAYPSMEPGIAYAKALKTWAKWIDTHLDLNKVAVFFRGYATSHFVATWDKGGRCDLETQPWNESFIPSYPQRMRDVEIAVSNMKVPPIILNVTQLSDMRKDGHISIWKMNSKGESMSSRIKHQDCSHWCLPGIPDTWNELLYYYLLKQEKT